MRCQHDPGGRTCEAARRRGARRRSWSARRGFPRAMWQCQQRSHPRRRRRRRLRSQRLPRTRTPGGWRTAEAGRAAGGGARAPRTTYPAWATLLRCSVPSRQKFTSTFLGRSTHRAERAARARTMPAWRAGPTQWAACATARCTGARGSARAAAARAPRASAGPARLSAKAMPRRTAVAGPLTQPRRPPHRLRRSTSRARTMQKSNPQCRHG